MIDAWGCDDDEWSLGAQIVTEQAFRYSEHSRARFTIRDSSLTRSGLFDEEDAIWRILRPTVEPIADTQIVGAERLLGPHYEGTAFDRSQFDIGRKESHRSIGRARLTGCTVRANGHLRLRFEFQRRAVFLAQRRFEYRDQRCGCPLEQDRQCMPPTRGYPYARAIGFHKGRQSCADPAVRDLRREHERRTGCCFNLPVLALGRAQPPRRLFEGQERTLQRRKQRR